MNASNEQKAVSPQRHIQLEVVANSIPMFFELLRSGFSADITVGCSLEHMLCNQMDIAPDYLRDRVQTVFMNNSPVDDITSAPVPDGAVISLSAAMPGLNGAVMRRGGLLSGMRRTISHSPDEVCIQPLPGRITLKLFNLIAKEVGPAILAVGVYVFSDMLNDFLGKQSGNFWSGCMDIAINNVTTQPDTLQKASWGANPVFLQVTGP